MRPRDGYRAVTHPSLPNYLALVSGSTQGLDGSDCSPGAGCQSDGPEHLLADPLAGLRREHARPVRRPKNAGDYAPRHNPPVYFTQVAAAVPGGRPPARARSAPTSEAAHLAPYTFITPNLCSDEHDCQVSDGDRWLARWVPRIVDSPAYRAGTRPSSSSPMTRTTTTRTTASTPWSSPRSVRPGTVAGDAFTHYSLLRTQEELLDLPLLGQAASAASMRTAFGLD